tara:strand:+ start:16 stop:579 length:564 start_codon:yes stop_codon:yes gene_type:complete
MRIIGGKFKGKIIFFKKSRVTRPLKDSVKENIFNIISHSNLLEINLKDSNVLDIYSGIGSFGLEAISRGASKVTFIENYSKTLTILKKNIANLSIIDNVELVSVDVFKFFSRNLTKKYEVIFLDPPFDDQSFHKILKAIYDKQIYNKQHVVIVHREDRMKEKFEDYLDPILVKNYGRSKIFFFKFLR